MRRLAMLLGLAAIAGCGTSEPRFPTQRYERPANPPGPPLAKVVALPPDAAASQVLSGLAGSALTPGHVDLGQGVVVATYSGDPEGFVDCGSVRFGRSGRSVPASRGSFTVNSLVGDEFVDGTIGRNLRLDSRMVIAAAPFDTRTSVSVDATHVLSKTVTVDDEIVRTESVAFDSRGEGSFQKGTSCHSSGKLEQLALEGIPGPLVILGGPPTQQVALAQPGPVQGAPIRQTELPSPSSVQPMPQAALPLPAFVPPPTGAPPAPDPAAPVPSAGQPASLDCAGPTGGAADQMCELLTLLAPYRSGAVAARLQGDVPLREGDAVVLELDLSGQPANLQLSYVDATGVVTHLPSLPVRGGIQHTIYATGLAVTRPFGEGMVLVLASDDPAIAGPRPPREPIASYVAALRQGLSGPVTRLDADAVVVTTTAR